MANILIVDDDLIIRKILSNFLKKKGYNVLVAVNGREGVAMAVDEHPDLILMDMRMPILDGWQATKQIKGNETTADIPIIALTAQTLGDDLQKSLDAGCESVLKKPVQLPSLITEINKMLQLPGPGG